MTSHRTTRGGGRGGGAAQEAWSRTRETVDELKDRLDLDRRVSEHPYGMVAAALGVGYVLGGGFFSPLTARIVGFGLRIGLRLAAIPYVENELRGFAETVTSGGGGKQDDAGGDEAGGEDKKSKGTSKGGKGQ